MVLLICSFLFRGQLPCVFLWSQQKIVRLPFAKDPISAVISDQEDADEYDRGVHEKKSHVEKIRAGFILCDSQDRCDSLDRKMIRFWWLRLPINRP